MMAELQARVERYRSKGNPWGAVTFLMGIAKALWEDNERLRKEIDGQRNEGNQGFCEDFMGSKILGKGK